MRILITGSKGFIGQPLTQVLRAQGHEVFGLDRRHDEDEWTFARRGDVEAPHYARCDIREFRQLERLISHWRPALVYHTAAEFGRWNGEDFYEDLWGTNIIGMKHLLRLQEHWRFRLVHFSSSEIYGDAPGEMSEDFLTAHPVQPLNDYAMTKVVNEWQIQNSHHHYGTQTVIVRCFNLYGPGEPYSPYRSVNCRFLYSAMQGWPLIVHQGHQRSCLYLDDAVRTLAMIATRFRSGAIYNLASTSLYSIGEIAEMAVKVMEADPALIQLERAEPMTTRAKRPTIQRAVQDLQHAMTVRLEEGMERTAAWMRAIYQAKDPDTHD